MTLVQGLFARSERLKRDLLELLKREPDAGARELDRLHEEVQADLAQAEAPVVYRLAGPEPAKATPMQYGGFFLERDRELLAQAKQRGTIWLWVDAGPDAYLDFVSDLPANVFAWDAQATGFSLAQMRELRKGTLCTNDPGADLPWESLSALGKEAAARG
jgi:hypothetical protein